MSPKPITEFALRASLDACEELVRVLTEHMKTYVPGEPVPISKLDKADRMCRAAIALVKNQSRGPEPMSIHKDLHREVTHAVHGLGETFKTMIKGFLNSQPWEVRCNECGTELCTRERIVNNDMDLIIRVSTCPACLEDAREEAQKDAIS